MADKIINDAFGGYIGMSRREIWHLRNGGLTRDQLRALQEKDKEYLVSVSDRNTLWKKPAFQYTSDNAIETYEAIAHDFVEEIMRSSLPVKYSPAKMRRVTPEEFIDMILFFREKAAEIRPDVQYFDDEYEYATRAILDCQHKMEVFIRECEQRDDEPYSTYFFQYEVLKNLRASVFEYPYLVKNAIVADIRHWKNFIIFDDCIRLDWLDEKNRTGVKVHKRIGNSHVFGSHGKTYETREEFWKEIDERDARDREFKKKKAEGKTRKVNPERPQITEIVRTGAPEHIIEMEPDAFIRQFNFWGGEFGSWVSQNERKENLVLAGNALADLAWVLNISEKEIGAGKLSFAFGARGKGGKRSAAAHYEPILNVINLTRENGAGCVAHEWGHYVDYKVLQPKGIGSGSPSMSWLKKRAPENDAEILTAFRDVYAKEEKMFATWFPSEKEFQDQVDACDSKKEYIEFFRKGINDYIKPKSFKNAEAWLRWVTVRASQEITSVPTDFYRNALSLDEGRKPYWSSDTELFARVVERYVLDLLTQKGTVNNYLVTLYAHEVEPYPSAAEMKLFTPHLEALFRENFTQREVIEAVVEPDRFSGEELPASEPVSFTNEQLSLF